MDKMKNVGSIIFNSNWMNVRAILNKSLENEVSKKVFREASPEGTHSIFQVQETFNQVAWPARLGVMNNGEFE